ncbi:hypothetical protein BGZ47_008971 [Haplosporangium gracile]|nr:hypothetical protein BGZ47_008971 [Haplosporangium gracile]
MISTTITAALTNAEQDIFATSADSDSQTNTAGSTCMSSRTYEPADKTTSSTCDVETQQQQSDAEYATSQDRQFQRFLRRFGGNRKSRS